MPKKSSLKTTPIRVTQSPIRLTKALSPQEFGKLIKHIKFGVAELAFSALNRILIEKGILTDLELQQAFLDEAERKGF